MIKHKYTGTYTARTKAQYTAALKQVIRAAKSLAGSPYILRLAAVAKQINHADSGNTSKAEEYRKVISVWTTYCEDLKTLECMKNLIITAGTARARQMQRKRHRAQQAQV